MCTLYSFISASMHAFIFLFIKQIQSITLFPFTDLLLNKQFSNEQKYLLRDE